MDDGDSLVLLFPLQDVLNNLGSSELDEDDLMLDLDLSDDQRHRHGNFLALFFRAVSNYIYIYTYFFLITNKPEKNPSHLLYSSARGLLNISLSSAPTCQCQLLCHT